MKTCVSLELFYIGHVDLILVLVEKKLALCVVHLKRKIVVQMALVFLPLAADGKGVHLALQNLIFTTDTMHGKLLALFF